LKSEIIYSYTCFSISIICTAYWSSNSISIEFGSVWIIYMYFIYGKGTGNH